MVIVFCVMLFLGSLNFTQIKCVLSLPYNKPVSSLSSAVLLRSMILFSRISSSLLMWLGFFFAADFFDLRAFPISSTLACSGLLIVFCNSFSDAVMSVVG